MSIRRAITPGHLPDFELPQPECSRIADAPEEPTGVRISVRELRQHRRGCIVVREAYGYDQDSMTVLRGPSPCDCDYQGLSSTQPRTVVHRAEYEAHARNCAGREPLSATTATPVCIIRRGECTCGAETDRQQVRGKWMRVTVDAAEAHKHLQTCSSRPQRGPGPTSMFTTMSERLAATSWTLVRGACDCEQIRAHIAQVKAGPVEDVTHADTVQVDIRIDGSQLAGALSAATSSMEKFGQAAAGLLKAKKRTKGGKA